MFAYPQNTNSGIILGTISEIVAYPNALDLNQHNNFALVEFSVNENGVINVNDINACQELKSYILKKLDGYELINPKNFKGKTFQYKLNFQK
jgi:hypothetical protein